MKGGAMSERPVQVSRAISFLWISIALDVAGLVLFQIDPDPNVSPGIQWIVGIFILSLIALLIYLTGRGRNWARITLLVLTALLIVPSVLGLPALAQRSLARMSIELAGIGFVLVAMYWLFTGAGAAYFRRAREKPE